MRRPQKRIKVKGTLVETALLFSQIILGYQTI